MARAVTFALASVLVLAMVSASCAADPYSDAGRTTVWKLQHADPTTEDRVTLQRWLDESDYSLSMDLVVSKPACGVKRKRRIWIEATYASTDPANPDAEIISIDNNLTTFRIGASIYD